MVLVDPDVLSVHVGDMRRRRRCRRRDGLWLGSASIVPRGGCIYGVTGSATKYGNFRPGGGVMAAVWNLGRKTRVLCVPLVLLLSILLSCPLSSLAFLTILHDIVLECKVRSLSVLFAVLFSMSDHD